MDDSSQSSNESDVLQVAGKIMVGTIIVFFVVIAFVFLLNLFARWYLSRNEDPNTVSWRRRRHRHQSVNGPGQDSPSTVAQRRGLDSSVLRSLPIVIHNPKNFKNGWECSVCLCEIQEGEKARLLPKCNHGFHVDCIDMWFQSNSTCPLCRTLVVSQCSSNKNHVEIPENFRLSSSDDAESPDLPTNVLYWGNQTQVSTHGFPLEGAKAENVSQALTASGSSAAFASNSGKPSDSVAIEIPVVQCSGCSSSSPSAVGFSEEEARSPVTTGLRSLKRLLSRGKRTATATCSGLNSVDADQHEEKMAM
ncbi:hypothetical protein Nepgr_005685 [Nepenthes gracilis]|uniref:RING-type E3 ubiquitin transferase n=1 Tax=Nepenthes gracilis TaxID=150966 RepID=A0AAD3S420_NEPGR|nr:hypothetical protein Nepgr_005685 [Nepenthes gracilis]